MLAQVQTYWDASEKWSARAEPLRQRPGIVVGHHSGIIHERARLRCAPPPSPSCVTRLASRRAGTDATPRLDLQGCPSRASNRRTHVVSMSAPIALKTWVVSSVRAVELHQSMTKCSSLTTTASLSHFQPCTARLSGARVARAMDGVSRTMDWLGHGPRQRWKSVWGYGTDKFSDRGAS